MMSFLRTVAGGVQLRVKIGPWASRDEITGQVGDSLKIRIAAPPVDSAANDALVDFLARQLGVARNSVEISRGRTSRTKTLLLRGIDLATARQRLSGG